MIQSKRLLVKGSLVVALGAIGLLMPGVAHARTLSCQLTPVCESSCPSPTVCAGCPGNYEVVCITGSGCGEAELWWCAPAT